MESQIRGMDQARRNASDGVSLAQTVESGLGEINAILQRLRELSVQSANDTNTSSDRDTLDSEATQLIASLDQIASSTEFNGRKVLDGTTASLTFQTGANNQTDQSITVNLGGVRAGQLGGMARSTGTAVDGTAITGAAGAGGVVINNTTIAGSLGFASDVGHSGTNAQDDSAYAKAKAINASNAGVKAVAETNVEAARTFAATSGTYTLAINGVNIFQSSSAASVGDMVNQINLHAEETGVTAAVAGGTFVLSANDGRNINSTAEAGAQGFIAAT